MFRILGGIGKGKIGRNSGKKIGERLGIEINNGRSIVYVKPNQLEKYDSLDVLQFRKPYVPQK